MNTRLFIGRVAGCLVAGAVISTLVAWGCEYRRTARYSSARHLGQVVEGPMAWPVAVERWPERWRSTAPFNAQTKREEHEGVGCVDRVYTAMDRTMNIWALHEISSGWPCVCAAWYDVRWFPYDGRPRNVPMHDFADFWLNGLHVTAVTLDDFPVVKQPVYFPISPLWRGMIINSSFYGAAVFGCLLGVGLVRRIRRRRLGLCETCGYPVGVSTVCTECGKARA